MSEVIHDPTTGQFLISSITSSNFSTLPGGTVRVTTVDPAVGAA
jgi:hypothetical protein